MMLARGAGQASLLEWRDNSAQRDNGSCFRSQPFADACRDLKLEHSFTHPYGPQTNGKAERFIQSALREWAYGIPYNHSSVSTAMLERWMHH
jgi:transposase InsO family protein